MDPQLGASRFPWGPASPRRRRPQRTGRLTPHRLELRQLLRLRLPVLPKGTYRLSLGGRKAILVIA